MACGRSGRSWQLKAATPARRTCSITCSAAFWPPSRSATRSTYEHERQLGIHRVDNPHYLDVSGQVIELARLDPASFDPRLAMPGWSGCGTAGR